jgi:hypothetical protein
MFAVEYMVRCYLVRLDVCCGVMISYQVRLDVCCGVMVRSYMVRMDVCCGVMISYLVRLDVLLSEAMAIQAESCSILQCKL